MKTKGWNPWIIPEPGNNVWNLTGWESEMSSIVIYSLWNHKLIIGLEQVDETFFASTNKNRLIHGIPASAKWP